jgi:hypothetical protein
MKILGTVPSQQEAPAIKESKNEKKVKPLAAKTKGSLKAKKKKVKA